MLQLSVVRSEQLLESMEWPEDLELEQLKQLVGEFDDIFALDGDDLGCTDVVKHKVDTGDSPPIKQYPRRTPFVQRAKTLLVGQSILLPLTCLQDFGRPSWTPMPLRKQLSPHYGLFEFTRMPFGLCNAPSTFQG